MNQSPNATSGTQLPLRAQPQSREVQLQSRDLAGKESATGSAWRAWLGYRRGRDFDQVPDDKGVGQDNAALYADDRYVVGVVCDGVSQGFFGDIAATVLTNGLLERFWKSRVMPPDTSTFEEWLIDLEHTIKQAVDKFEIPLQVREPIREELESLKTAKGSQAVLAAFVLDREKGLLKAYQVGDAFLYAYVTPDRNSQAMGQEWARLPQSAFEESTVHLQSDPRGRVRSLGNSQRYPVCASLTGVCGVAVHSDGAPKDWGATLMGLNTPEALQDSVERWANKDDVAFVVALAPSLLMQLNRRPALPPPPPSIEELPGTLELEYQRRVKVRIHSLTLPYGVTVRVVSPEWAQAEVQGEQIVLAVAPDRNANGKPILLESSDGKRYSVRYTLREPIEQREPIEELPGTLKLEYRRSVRVPLEGFTARVRVVSPEWAQIETEGEQIVLVAMPDETANGNRILLESSDGKRYAIRYTLRTPIEKGTDEGGKNKSRPQKMVGSKLNVLATTLLALLLMGGVSTVYLFLHNRPPDKKQTEPQTKPQTNTPPEPAPINLGTTEGKKQALQKLGYPVQDNLASTVRQYQKDKRLNPNGMLSSPRTLSCLKADLDAKGIPYKPRSSATEAKQPEPPIDLNTPEGQIQALQALDYDVDPDNFKDTVKNYQQVKGINPVNGNVGPQTLEQLVADLEANGIPHKPLPSGN